jgi:hypothetical protein
VPRRTRRRRWRREVLEGHVPEVDREVRPAEPVLRTLDRVLERIDGRDVGGSVRVPAGEPTVAASDLQDLTPFQLDEVDQRVGLIALGIGSYRHGTNLLGPPMQGYRNQRPMCLPKRKRHAVMALRLCRWLPGGLASVRGRFRPWATAFREGLLQPGQLAVLESQSDRRLRAAHRRMQTLAERSSITRAKTRRVNDATRIWLPKRGSFRIPAQRRSAANACLHVTQMGKHSARCRWPAGLWAWFVLRFAGLRPGKGGQE